MSSILILEDDVEQLETLSGILVSQGHDIRCAATATRALEMARSERFDLVIADIFIRPDGELGQDGGFLLIARLRRMWKPAPTATRPDVPILAISGVIDGASMGFFLEGARSLGANLTLRKPVGAQTLGSAVAELLGKPRCAAQ